MTIHAISPLDGRYEEKLSDLRSIFSEYGLIRFRVLIEVRWLQFLVHEAHLPEISSFSDASLLDPLIHHFSEKDACRVKEIEKKINHDVKAVEYFIKEYMAPHKNLNTISEFIHFGCTSEDINNLAYGIMLKSARDECILPTLTQFISHLKKIAHTEAAQPMLSHTHGQPATPTTVGKEIANVIARLEPQIDYLKNMPIFGKLNGASGNYNALAVTYPDIDWQLLSRQFIETLGLNFNPYTTQIEPHDALATFFHILIRINTILIDLNRDIWGYISLDYFKLKILSHEVGSSAMPHKVNPIDFENAEGNLGIANALFEHMASKLPISRWQRDLSDSTVLRNIGVAIGHSLLAYQSTEKGFQKITPNPEKLNQDLENHWEILAEPIQMMMRRFGISEPYEKLKALTRGQPITKSMLHEFIHQLPLPDEAKKQLLALTPSNYVGYASDLAKRI